MQDSIYALIIDFKLLYDRGIGSIAHWSSEMCVKMEMVDRLKKENEYFNKERAPTSG